jgi:glutamate racemase
MKSRTRRVAMFDSGLGGLTVLSALRRCTPDVDVIYAADTAHVPYGDRPLEEVAGFATQIISHLQRYDPDLLIIACGTSCSAFDTLGQPALSVPTLAVVDCGARAAAQTSAGGLIGVIATAATIRSGIFERKIKRALPHATITAVGAPKLVPLVESGAWNSEDAGDAVAAYCRPFVSAGCDTVVLGCTHFPLLGEWFARSLPAQAALIDPALECAREAATILDSIEPGKGTVTFEVSGDADQFMRNVRALAPEQHAGVLSVDFSDQVKQPEYH